MLWYVRHLQIKSSQNAKGPQNMDMVLTFYIRNISGLIIQYL